MSTTYLRYLMIADGQCRLGGEILDWGYKEPAWWVLYSGSLFHLSYKPACSRNHLFRAPGSHTTCETEFGGSLKRWPSFLRPVYDGKMSVSSFSKCYSSSWTCLLGSPLGRHAHRQEPGRAHKLLEYTKESPEGSDRWSLRQAALLGGGVRTAFAEDGALKDGSLLVETWNLSSESPACS